MRITSLDKNRVFNEAMALNPTITSRIVRENAEKRSARADRAENGFEGARANEFATRHMLERLMTELQISIGDCNDHSTNAAVAAIYKDVQDKENAVFEAKLEAGDIRLYYGHWVKRGTQQYEDTLIKGQTREDGSQFEL